MKKYLLLAAMSALMVSQSAQSAPTAAAPECLVTGTVQSIEEREHVYEPREWAESWNLPESITYIDVTMNVTAVERYGAEMIGECDHTLGKRVFQLDHGVEKPEINSCIKAVTHFSGDEFRIGNWLKSFEETDDCIEKE